MGVRFFLGSQFNVSYHGGTKHLISMSSWDYVFGGGAFSRKSQFNPQYHTDIITLILFLIGIMFLVVGLFLGSQSSIFSILSIL